MVFPVAVTSHSATVRIVDGFLECKAGASSGGRYKVVVEHDKVVKLERSLYRPQQANAPQLLDRTPPMGPPTHNGKHRMKKKIIKREIGIEIYTRTERKNEFFFPLTELHILSKSPEVDSRLVFNTAPHSFLRYGAANSKVQSLANRVRAHGK